ncbi:response regulator transcription factor [Alicyclobacillus tolerans]|uniref:response regulator transcription factor n=1 Tax=Alicyclobacillus tolerans TaxID=90970 RepID=UPI001F260C9F|nr:response regulator transcription factor [Alicyclobacillus tolerans]MCF8566100.1 response regulator transcription factor [Alicyclobacillus tolerans]
MGEITILLVDDHVLVRQGIRALLEEEPGLKVVGEAQTGDEALPVAFKLQPQVVLMDVHMPKGIDGITATRRIREALPNTRVIMLTMLDDEAHIERMLEAGASGVLFKHDSSDEIIKAIHATSTPGAPPYLPARLPDPLRKRVFMHLNNPNKETAQLLSPRETEVLTLIALGHTNKEIADRLHISIKTVEAHRAHIIERIGADSRADLIQYAVNHDLIMRGMP